ILNPGQIWQTRTPAPNVRVRSSGPLPTPEWSASENWDRKKRRKAFCSPPVTPQLNDLCRVFAWRGFLLFLLLLGRELLSDGLLNPFGINTVSLCRIQQNVVIGLPAIPICRFEQADLKQQARQAALVIAGDVP